MYVRFNLATKPLVAAPAISRRRSAAGRPRWPALPDPRRAILQFAQADADLRRRAANTSRKWLRCEEQRRELDRYFSQGETAKLQGRANFIRNVIEARSINWTQMFMDLEKTLPAGIHVVRIEPRLEKGVVTVKFVVGAANEEAKLKFESV